MYYKIHILIKYYNIDSKIYKVEAADRPNDNDKIKIYKVEIIMGSLESIK